MLHTRGELPVADAFVPAAQRVGIVGAPRLRGAERGVRHRAALAVARGIDEIAVGHEVAVGVVPCARGAGDQTSNGRRIGAEDRAAILRAEIVVQADLHRSLAVAEHVVRQAASGRQVLPRGAVGALDDDVAVRREGAGTDHRGGIADAEEAVAEPAGQRQPLRRPPILHEYGMVGVEVGHLAERRGVERDSVGHAVVEPELHRRVERERVVVVRDAAENRADLEGMRARDVRGSRAPVEQVVRADARIGASAIAEAGRLFQHEHQRNGTRREVRIHGIHDPSITRQRGRLAVARDRARRGAVAADDARLEQDPAGHRGRPLRHNVAIRIRDDVIDGVRFRREARGQLARALA